MDNTDIVQQQKSKIAYRSHSLSLHYFSPLSTVNNHWSPFQFAAKELQKINAFRAPREKLNCIMNCCRVINNLLLNASLSTNRMPAGADDFLPILIYVTIRVS